MLVAIALPIALQNLINVGVGMADTLMLGKLGETELSGASLGTQPYFILTLIFFGLSSGASVLTAQYWGKGDTKTIRRIMGIAMRIALMVAAGFVLVIQLFPEMVMRIFTPEADVVREAVSYLRIVSVSYLCSAFTILYLNIIRSVEKVMISLGVFFTSFCLNVVLNWMLIFGVPQIGIEPMGVAGAAWATLISRIVEVILTVIYAFKVDKIIKFRLKNLLERDQVLTRDFRKYSMPVIFNELLWGVGISMHSVILGHLGKEAVAASAIAKIIQQLSTVVMFGIANASAIIIGKSLGLGDRRYAKQSANTLLILATGVGVLSAGIIIALRPVVFAMYDLAEVTLYYVNAMMLILAVSTLFQAFNCTTIIGILRGGGDTRFALIIDASTLWLGSLVLGTLGAFVFQWSVPVVFALLLVDEMLKLPAGLIRVRGGHWLKNLTRNLEESPG
ncbi:MAG: MATE family efflux transporter [Clostridiales bacterium]|nr:MATE family efflux transporter [Clostridiales bacterium]